MSMRHKRKRDREQWQLHVTKVIIFGRARCGEVLCLCNTFATRIDNAVNSLARLTTQFDQMEPHKGCVLFRPGTYALTGSEATKVDAISGDLPEAHFRVPERCELVVLTTFGLHSFFGAAILNEFDAGALQVGVYVEQAVQDYRYSCSHVFVLRFS